MTSGADDLRAWDAAASTYAAVVGVEGDAISARFGSFLWRHLEPLDGRSVLDVGCGHGWLAQACAERGADVVGIDGSAELLAVARLRAPGVAFHLGDLTAGLPDEIERIGFDAVIAHMVLMDVPDLTALGISLRGAVRPEGRVVITMCHPAFFRQPIVEDATTGERYRKVKGYLQHEEWWIMSFGGHRHYHRPLSFYISWLADAGFAVIDLVEPPVPIATPEAERTDYERWFSEIPTMLGIAAVRLT